MWSMLSSAVKYLTVLPTIISCTVKAYLTLLSLSKEVEVYISRAATQRNIRKVSRATGAVEQ